MNRLPELLGAAGTARAAAEPAGSIEPGEPERWFTLADARAHADDMGDHDLAGGLVTAFGSHLAAMRAGTRQSTPTCNGIRTSMDRPAITSGQVRLPHLAVAAGQPLITALREAGAAMSKPVPGGMPGGVRFHTHPDGHHRADGPELFTTSIVIWEAMDRDDARQWLGAALPSEAFIGAVEMALPQLLDLKSRLRAALVSLADRSAATSVAALLAGGRYLSIRLIWQHESVFSRLLPSCPVSFEPGIPGPTGGQLRTTDVRT